MNRWFGGMRVGVLALVLGGTLAACGGGGDGDGGGVGQALRLFFGMNGDGSCSSVIVNVDLESAGAVLSHNSLDQPECSLESTLASLGCFATFLEVDDGATLRVTVLGCEIPASTNLFACNFDDVDLSQLVTETGIQCACKVPGCDETPPLCIDEDPDPTSCEDCSNGDDDDGNGKTDCNDPNCANVPPCNGGPTTTSTSTTLAPVILPIHFTLASASGPVTDLRMTVNYASAPGQLAGEGTDVECRKTIPNATLEAEDKDAIRRLALHLSKPAGINEKTMIVTCDFLPRAPEPVPSNFTVVVNSATGLDGKPVSVKVRVTTGD